MTIIDDLKAIEAEATKGIAQAPSLAELDRIRVAVAGKKGQLTALLRQMGSLDAQDRPRVGKLAKEVRAAVEGAAASSSAPPWRRASPPTPLT